MRNRTRSVFAKKPTLKQEEWLKIQQESRASKAILESDEFQFLRDYLSSVLDSVRLKYATQAINDAQTIEKFPSGVIRKIFHPAQKEYTLLAGEYRLAERLLSDLEQYSKNETEIMRRFESGEIVIEGEDGV